MKVEGNKGRSARKTRKVCCVKKGKDIEFNYGN